MYDYGICYCFLTNHGHLMLIDFFYNKLTLAILYRVVGTRNDREPLFMRADKQ